MTFIENIEAQDQSVTATVCENAALYGAAPERDEFDSRDIWDRDDATDAVLESFRILCEGVAPGRVPARRRTREPALGLRQHARQPDPAPRPCRRPADARPPRPPARPGRHRDQGARAGAGHRPRAEPHRPPRRLRDPARPGRRSLPRRDRRHVAAPARVARVADRQADQRRHRRPRLPARPQGPQDASAPAAGAPSSPSPAARTSPTRRR